MSMGIALYTFYKRQQCFDFKLRGAFYGDSDKRDLLEVIKAANMSQFIKSIHPLDLNIIVDDIIDYPIVWFDEKAEIGPRALGHRCLIADARYIKSKDILNRIKQRQWWRPVAPIVDYKFADMYFDNVYFSPYMLHTFNIKTEYSKDIHAICHIDNSARIQTADNSIGRLYEVVKSYEAYTNIPLLCNTSLNDKGEPIINKIEEALDFALRKQIPIVYINGSRLELHNFSNYTKEIPFKRNNTFDQWLSESEINDWKEKLNPYNLPFIYIQMYILEEGLHMFRLENEKDVKLLKNIIDKLLINEQTRRWIESGVMYLNK